MSTQDTTPDNTPQLPFVETIESAPTKQDRAHKREIERSYYERHREECLARAKVQREKDPAKLKAYQQQYREKNRERLVEVSRQWREKNPDYHREQSREYHREHADLISEKRKVARRQLKQTVLNAYGGCCACCGEDTFEFLTLDHVLGDGAAHRKALGADNGGRSEKVYRDLIARGFPPEYRLLCWSCNSSRGFYGYCPHSPEDESGIPPGRRGNPRKITPPAEAFLIGLLVGLALRPDPKDPASPPSPPSATPSDG